MEINKVKIKIAVYIGIFICIATLIEIGILAHSNSNHVKETSEIILEQVENILINNEQKEKEIDEELKTEYIEKAKTVAYILGEKDNPDVSENELRVIAYMLHIDEIHLFDENSVLYKGTNPEYYGMSFNSGEQVSYFKPMLEDRTLSMCQDVTPNTAISQNMMYAITWDKTKTYMIQVGVEPIRLLNAFENNKIDKVINDIPVYEGMNIYVADINDGSIKGSTHRYAENDTVYSNLAFYNNDNLRTIKEKIITDDGYLTYCYCRQYKDYIIIAVHSTKADVTKFITAISVEIIWLLLAGVFILCILFKLVDINKQINEDKIIKNDLSIKAYTDELTGLLNRRAYEKDMLSIKNNPEDKLKNLVYAAIDVNGLKMANDNLGHLAGDEIIKGAANCLKKILGVYGNVYRTGGDEFVSVFYADDEQLEFIKSDLEIEISNWKGTLVKELSISVGYVPKSEFPNTTIDEISKIADERMYGVKNNYYATKGIDRRGQAAAHKALCNLYTKILKINLTDDSYSIINMDTKEQLEEMSAGFISKWLYNFGLSGHVYKDDLEDYFAKTNITYLKEYFKKGKTSINIIYRRKYGNEFKQTSMEMIPANDYNDNNQSLFLYVKLIDK